MRVAFIGVSHWHTPFYIEPVAALPECAIVGVADPDERVAASYAGRFATTAFSDYRRMCEKARPELVFALGRHVDMPAEAEYLIGTGTPFAMEKPCGVRVADVERLEGLARERGVFAAVPFVYRMSRFRELVARHSPGKELVYGMFRQIPGSVARYRAWGVEWNLERRLAGGGCTLNLSIHFFDLLRVLAPSVTWSVDAASMSSALSGADVEDFSATVLSGGGRRATVETGYVFPGAGGETVLSVNMGGDYYRWDGPRSEVVLTREDGSQETFAAAADQVASYAPFVRDTLRRVGAGEPP